MKTACINARSLNETIFRAHADLLVLCGKPVDAIYQELKKIIPFFDDFIKKNDFSWIKSSSSFCVPFSDAGVVRYVYVMGLEQNDNHYKASEELRKAIGSLIRYAEKNKLFKIAFDISALNNAHERKLCIEEIIIASHVAHYHFDDFITDTARQTRGIIELLFCDDQENTLFDDAQEIGVAINTARHWSDLPPSILYPDTFAKEIKNYLQNIQNVSVEILDKSAIQALKMGGVLGVCQGSVHEPKVVVA